MPQVQLPVDFILTCWEAGDSATDIAEFLMLTGHRPPGSRPVQITSVRAVIRRARRAGDPRARRLGKPGPPPLRPPGVRRARLDTLRRPVAKETDQPEK